MSNYQSQQVVWGKAFRNSVINAFLSRPSGALIASAKLRLSKDPTFSPVPSSVIADLTGNECDFTGYVGGGASVTPGAPVNINGNTQGSLLSNTYIATTGGSFIGNTVTGYWLDNGTDVIASEAFASNRQAHITSPGDYLELDVALPLPGYADAV